MKTSDSAQEAQKRSGQVIHVSSADPHRAGMKSVSFLRQVLVACVYPELLREERLPLDVRMRAQELLQACAGGSVGGGEAAGWGGGAASDRCADPHALPPLLDHAGVTLVPYVLREDRDWTVDLDQLHLDLLTTRGRCRPRAIYINNPGNPTGHVQDRKSMEDVIRFAVAERLLLLIDEDSVFGRDREFVSYKKVLFDMGHEYSGTVELVSFHSVSNACTGECGLRAGYMEFVNMDPAVMLVIGNLLNTDICAPVTGQLTLDLMVDPPKPGEPSYDKYMQEILLSRATLSQNAQRACDFLNSLPGMSCQPAMGGVYLYPRLHVPPLITAEAK
ncbi:hypothetical protein LDENG_00047730, partial [Lucifuga dentata]